MEKVDAAASQPASSAAVDSQRTRSFWRRNWDFAGVVLLIIASFPTTWLTRRTVTIVPNLGLIDDNWHLDYTFKALRHIWIGRDVAFTHGPIFQWLSSIPARTLPLHFGGLYATWNTVPVWCAFVFAYCALRLLLPEQPPWKRFVLLLLIASFWETSLRTTLPIFFFALFLLGWYAARDGRVRVPFVAVGGALLCVIAFLVAGDTGIYATAAWIICFGAFAFEARREGMGKSLIV